MIPLSSMQNRLLQIKLGLKNKKLPCFREFFCFGFVVNYTLTATLGPLEVPVPPEDFFPFVDLE